MANASLQMTEYGRIENYPRHLHYYNDPTPHRVNIARLFMNGDYARGNDTSYPPFPRK